MITPRRFLFATMLLAGCQGGSPKATTSAAIDPPAAVEAVLTRWYDAMQKYDSAGIAAPLAAEFFIFEDTTVIAGPDLVREVLAGASAGSQTASLSQFKTVVTDSVAWTSFHNQEIWTPKSGTPDTLRFLESVVFVKRNGQWLMERYHATRINRPAPAPQR